MSLQAKHKACWHHTEVMSSKFSFTFSEFDWWVNDFVYVHHVIPGSMHKSFETTFWISLLGNKMVSLKKSSVRGWRRMCKLMIIMIISDHFYLHLGEKLSCNLTVCNWISSVALCTVWTPAINRKVHSNYSCRSSHTAWPSWNYLSS